MKFIFLLDENIVRNALETARKYGLLRSCAQLLRDIHKNCHSIGRDPAVTSSYLRHMEEVLRTLKTDPQHWYSSPVQRVFNLVRAVIRDKSLEEHTPSPPLPTAIEELLPQKDRAPEGQDDIIIARAAVRFSAKIVTTEEEFMRRVNNYVSPHYPTVEALQPRDALEKYASKIDC